MRNISKAVLGLAATGMFALGNAGMASAAVHEGWGHHHHHHGHHHRVSVDNSTSILSDIGEWEDSPVCVGVNRSDDTTQNIVCPNVEIENSPFSLVLVGARD